MTDRAARAPIFVGGMMKSGTTLLRAMLGQHRAIAAGLESQWFLWDWAAKDTPAFDTRLDRLATFFDLPRQRVAAHCRASATAEAFLDALMADLAAAAGKPRWCEKTPGNVAHLERIWAHWPDAHVIHIIRDPRDAYASYIGTGKTRTPEDYAVRWLAIMAENAAQVARLRPQPERYLEIRYETLCLHPEATMRRVIAMVGADWDPACAVFAGKGDEFQKVLDATGHASTTLERLKQPLTTDRLQIWPEVLDPRQLAGFHAALDAAGAGDLARRLEADTEPLLAGSPG